jgi:hypothetical protein
MAWARWASRVDQVRVHVLGVARGIVAHGVEDHRRVAARDADVERGMPGVAVGLVRAGRFPIVVAEVRLGEGHQHPHVVGRPQDFGEAQVRAGLAAVVVRVDEIDPEALEPLQALAGPRVCRPRGTDLGVVQRHGRQEDAAAVQEEVPPVDPELAEAEARRQGDVQDLSSGLLQRQAQLIRVGGSVQVPESIGFPRGGKGHAAVLQVGGLECLVRELRGVAAAVADPGPQRVLPARRQARHGGGEGDLPCADRGGHAGVVDSRARRLGLEEHVAAQAAPLHRALHLSGRGRVVVRQQHRLQRHGRHHQAQDVLAARPAERSQIGLARREAQLAGLPAVHEHGGVGVQALHGQHDAAAGPVRRHGELPLIPGRGDPAQALGLPGRMGVNRLAVLLHVIGDPRPTARDFEVSPAADRHGIRGDTGRLPSPQAVQADAPAGGRLLAMRLAQVPDRRHAGGQHDVVLCQTRPRRQDDGQEQKDHPIFFHSAPPSREGRCPVGASAIQLRRGAS